MASAFVEIAEALFLNDLPRAIICGLAAGLLNEHVYDSLGISSSLAWWLGAIAIICCAVAVLSLLHYFLGNDKKILAVISVILGVMILSQSFGILSAVDEYETYYDSEVARQQKGRISFLSNSVQCTQCRGRKKCTVCKGDQIAKYGGIWLKCKGCNGSGECQMCDGTGRKQY